MKTKRHTMVVAADAVGGVSRHVEHDALDCDKSRPGRVRTYSGVTGISQSLEPLLNTVVGRKRPGAVPSDLESSSTEMGSYLGGRRSVTSFDITMMTDGQCPVGYIPKGRTSKRGKLIK